MSTIIDEIEETDDGTWDDWDIPRVPGEFSCPVNESPQPEPSLDFSLAWEIRVLRVLLQKIEARVAVDDEPERLVLPLTRLVESIARTIRIHSGITGGPDSELQAVIDRVFKDLGLDG